MFNWLLRHADNLFMSSAQSGSIGAKGAFPTFTALWVRLAAARSLWGGLSLLSAAVLTICYALDMWGSAVIFATGVLLCSRMAGHCRRGFLGRVPVINWVISVLVILLDVIRSMFRVDVTASGEVTNVFNPGAAFNELFSGPHWLHVSASFYDIGWLASELPNSPGGLMMNITAGLWVAVIGIAAFGLLCAIATVFTNARTLLKTNKAANMH